MSSRARHSSFSTTDTTSLTPSAAALAGLQLRNGTAASVQLATITGLPGPYVVLGAYPALPAGLVASCSGVSPPGAMTLAGTPTAAANGTWSLAVSNTAAAAPRSVPFTMQIAAVLAPIVAVPTSLWRQNIAIAPMTPINAFGGYTPYAWSAVLLPAGLTLSAVTGAITGTPTASSGSTLYAVTITDTLGGTGGSVSANFSATVAAPLAATVAVSTVAWTQNTTIAPVTPVAGSGGYAPYVWSASTLPAGLSINASTGAITGTPTTISGSTAYTITITDSVGGSGGSATGAFSASVTAGSGAIPTQKAPIGIVYAANYPIGSPIFFDYGLLAGTSTVDYWNNSPAVFAVVVKLGGTAVQSGTNITQYTPLAAGTLTYTVVPSNGAGPGSLAQADGVDIV